MIRAFQFLHNKPLHFTELRKLLKPIFFHQYIEYAVNLNGLLFGWKTLQVLGKEIDDGVGGVED
jgi:hypothetical protein